ncbi:DUF2630 family protein [Serinicoccus profundi]|uniref:DUF2630 family protein n=1 Tax=Serinicoccus profundi TaxID=1078471 RepID=UPI0011C8F6DC|nr:DUF2630 family protein [Serinicoccus profundi]
MSRCGHGRDQHPPAHHRPRGDRALAARPARAGGRSRPRRSTSVAQVEGELDRLWDLLRQRAAKREFGEDPDDARERSADTVEHYRN